MIEYIVDPEEPLVEGMIKVPGITQRYQMPSEIESKIRQTPYSFGFGAFSTAVYMRTYSRLMDDGRKELFPDTIVRVVKGIISIVKDWKLKHGLGWDDDYWNDIALRMGISMMKMQFLPSGRNLWAQGTEFCYKKGASCLNNCGFVSTSVGLVNSMSWTIDSLMAGAGCGHDDEISEEELSKISIPGCSECRTNVGSTCSCRKRLYKIHDSREGWVKSVNLLVKSYYDGVVVHFDYSGIRPPNKIIKGFGGTTSGPEPLRILHERIRIFIECYLDVNRNGMTPYDAIVKMTRNHIEIFNNPITQYIEDGVVTTYPADTMEKSGIEYSLSLLLDMSEDLRVKKTYGKSRLICDLFNAIGSCVVSGNVRRSAEISLSTADNEEFKNLKNYTLNPERMCIGWLSNNTVKLSKTEDFEQLPSIAERIRDNAEPGILNVINTRKFGRVTPREKIGREAEPDNANGINPCITGDSLIETLDGILSVKELVGRKFTTYNPLFSDLKSDGLFSSTQEGFWSNGVKPVFRLTLINGNSIKATKEHKFFVVDKLDIRDTGNNKSIYKTKELQSIDMCNDLVFVSNNCSPQGILNIEYVGEEEVFDCSIPGPNCLFANEILVHNCGEIPLNNYEFCNLSECFPTRCDTYEELEEAVRLATIYSSIVSLLPTHWVQTNKIIAYNHRIGVSISGVVEEVERTSSSIFTKKLRSLYKVVRQTNTEFSMDNGVLPSKRVTTGKPSGTLSQLVGCSSGLHFPTYKYCIRRMRQASNLKLTQILKDAGYPWEYDKYSGEKTTVFSFPLNQNKAREATSVSMWEQASNLAMMQAEWGDNSISCTIYFNPKTEANDLEHLLAHYCPLVKSLSALPHSDDIVYEQAPYERITEEEYYKLSSGLKELDFSSLNPQQSVVTSSYFDVSVTSDSSSSSDSTSSSEPTELKRNLSDKEHIEEDPTMERGCESGVCDYKAYMEAKRKKNSS